jgi:hypothetical protein
MIVSLRLVVSPPLVASTTEEEEEEAFDPVASRSFDPG